MSHKIIISILLATALSNCATPQPIVKIAQLTRPARPVLPSLSIDQAQKIEQKTWDILVIRHRMLRQYAEMLEVIIDGGGIEK